MKDKETLEDILIDMKKLKAVNEDDRVYTNEDVVELSEDIDYLIENKPKGIRKGSKPYKAWLKAIDDRMAKYNKIVGKPVYVKNYNPE